MPNQFREWWSKRQAQRIYSSSRPPGSIDHMDVHSVAEKLQGAGITRDTMILVWHTSTRDLDILKGFLESAGYTGILPPKENCIPLIQVMRMNLSEGAAGYRMFPLGLEVLFPVMWPRHSLIGLNHQALVDCQQTRLICMGFDELCRPIEERGAEWRPETVAKTAQTSLDSWLQKKSIDEDSNDGTRQTKRLKRLSIEGEDE
ncbi:hypothetical protein B0I35DRAFT_6299 [Stachybotrys elegans]|uniref:Uncharacterized protein n=1 Tax=Stachybotrys elegans TaxID=80388 RepID=A0A8K0T0W1_9HYPO|nr:hypothetical protein B0I35DRAFT_6299 [Stachybotrys elegans]